ncbi:hypothetical protein [Cypionkella sp. TWP1-2-1b2]|uniref:hypothetical protein n=1 Tax=Cypionkella sp. TWP1-2-1b2 TaxID=2804675 RepID=UPI003CF87AA3
MIRPFNIYPLHRSFPALKCKCFIGRGHSSPDAKQMISHHFSAEIRKFTASFCANPVTRPVLQKRDGTNPKVLDGPLNTQNLKAFGLLGCSGNLPVLRKTAETAP